MVIRRWPQRRLFSTAPVESVKMSSHQGRTDVTEKDALRDWGRALEDDYFRKRDKELIEAIRRRAEAGAERRRLGR